MLALNSDSIISLQLSGKLINEQDRSKDVFNLYIAAGGEMRIHETKCNQPAVYIIRE